MAARRAAARILHRVVKEKRPLDDELAQARDIAALAPRDRAFARLLIATVLRRLPELDRALAGLMDRPLPAKAAEARWALRLGAAQLLFLESPPHAAVATSVDLLSKKASGFKGLVNAVLRRLVREGRPLPPCEAAKVNTPDWLWQSWTSAYGAEQAQAIGEAHLREPPLDLTAKGDAGALAERLGATLLPLGAVRLASGSGDPQRLPGYAEGDWWVQDQAAALPVQLLPTLAGRRVADLCAAPGGKTLQLAAAGAEVTAVDRNEARLVRLRENLARCGLDATVVQEDATAWKSDQDFDAVLLDAPCSATGTLRRHPDIARNRSRVDMAAVIPLQKRLLRAARGHLRPGGTLIYAVCSLQPEEGPEQTDALLAESADLRRQPIRPEELAGLGALIDGKGDLRSLPSHLDALGGMDGFYACRLERLA